MSKISVVINTYNAEKFLDRVLDSVKDYDEILICDMHSTDNTIKIAEKYGCKIVYHKKESYVEPARNFAIQSAANDWVLLIDADEVVSQTLSREIKNLLQTKEFDALSIPRNNYFMDKQMRNVFPDYNIRFFRKDKVYWPEEIHSTPKIDGKIIQIKKKRSLALEHLSNDSVSDILKKMEKYVNAEVARRGAKKVSLFKFIFSPLLVFIKFYFIKAGILDGKKGYLYSMMKAHYKFYTLSKINEAKK